MTVSGKIDGLKLFDQARSGDRIAMGRLISMLENNGKQSLQLIQQKGKIIHDSVVMGITGAPGAGKSTLIGSLLSLWVKENKKVAVLAVDPSSPFSGGAVLGDRVRMLAHSNNENVIIRSVGTRGHLGGVAACIAETVEIMIAMGMDIVLVETAGAGQIDVEVGEITDSTIVVLYPGWGDAMQVAKAGILEIADIYVVNKKDLPFAEVAVRDIELMLDYRQETGWKPKVMLTKGDTGEGLEDLWGAVKDHQNYLASSGEKKKRRQYHLAYLIRRMAVSQLSSTWKKSMLMGLADDLMKQEIDYNGATTKALEALRKDVKEVLGESW